MDRMICLRKWQVYDATESFEIVFIIKVKEGIVEFKRNVTHTLYLVNTALNLELASGLP